MIRASVQHLAPYVPGEQPKLKRIVKLNANENAYPPSPKIAEALAAFDPAQLRLYPDPTFNGLRHILARRYGCKDSNIFVGNGSDEVLRLATDVFCRNAAHIGVFDPSYSLYPVLSDIREAPLDRFPLPDSDDALASLHLPDPAPDLFFLVNPNAPTGTRFGMEAVRAFARNHKDMTLVIDEAYTLFAGADCMRLAFEEPNVLVSRTFSKAWSLAGIRVGVIVGPENLIDALYKVKDSYNVDKVAQLVATAALEDPDWMENNVAKIRATRERFSAALTDFGWNVTPSFTNFVWCVPPADTTAEEVQALLRTRGILVRRFNGPGLSDHLRITIGTDEQMDEILALVAPKKSSRRK